jgi:hypothetical protein
MDDLVNVDSEVISTESKSDDDIVKLQAMHLIFQLSTPHIQTKIDLDFF